MTCRTRPFRGRGRCSPDEFRPHDLDSIVKRYISSKHRQEALDELAEFRDQPSFRDCIEQAGRARVSDEKRRDGKRANHQRRIPEATLRAWTETLLRKSDAMRSSSSFDALFEIVDKESRKLWGIGELTVYDTALRIGAYHELELEPKEIYLHAGTREGAKALGFDGSRRSIRRDKLPEAFQQLKPYQIEDCLCIYADDLKRLGRLAFE